MATTNERLEQIENALFVLLGTGAGYSVGKRGAVGAMTAASRTAGRYAIRGGLQTPQGRALLAGIAYSELVDELQERDREIARAEGTENLPFEALRQLPGPIPILPGFTASLAKKARKKTVSKFNKAVSVGMATVKRSTSFGRPGSFSNSKKAFATVTKTIYGLKKGRKAAKTGIRAKIARAVRKYI